MNEISICQLSQLDSTLLKKIIDQDSQMFPDPWSEKVWNESVLVPHYYVAASPNSWALVQLNTFEGLIHLLKIYVSPHSRRQGQGDQILKALFEWSKIHAIKRCYLEVDKANQIAVSFYLRQGFKILHEIKAFYSDGRDALIMELNY